MADHDDLPAEVRAAIRALGQNTAKEEPTAIASTTVRAPISSTVDQLLEEILGADQVDIVGILPWQCALRLIELKVNRRDANRSIIHPAAVRYYTPANSVITRYRKADAMGTLAQRWIGGITGVRNWLRTQAQSLDVPETLTLCEFDDIYLDCIVSTISHARRTVTVLSQLPMIRPASFGDGSGDATLVITRMPDEQLPGFQGYLEKLKSQSRLMRPVQILCRLEQGSPQRLPEFGNEFRPILQEFYPRLEDRPENSVVPAAIVAVCAPTARGPAVVLKNRTARNSVDDIGTLSLISERVLHEDLSNSLDFPSTVDYDKVLDELWVRSGKPDTFEVPESAFRQTARRELFLCCGLDVPDDRLHLRGKCLVEREGENRFLGFYVYRLDLIRRPDADEVKHVLSWNPELEQVLVSDLYQSAVRKRLNRLLRQREPWLRQAVFDDPNDVREGNR